MTKCFVIVIMGLLFSSCINKRDKERKDMLHAKNLSGLWMRGCDGFGGHVAIPDSSDNEVVIEVNFNQIVIGAKMDTTGFDSRGIVLFRLTEPGDLGRGGMMLDWAHFSKDSVIAKMEMTGKATAVLTWYGFYDKKIKKRTWVHNFDMLIDSNGNSIPTNTVHVVNCDKR